MVSVSNHIPLKSTQLLFTAKYSEAIDHLQNLPTGKNFEAAEKTVNDIYLRTAAINDFVFTVQDSLALLNIASQCVYIAGPSVYTARVLYANLVNGNAMFLDEYLCKPQRQNRKNNDALNQSDDISFIIYPNPTNNRVNIYSKLKENISLQVVFTDIVGKAIIYNNNLNSNENASIDISQLSKGLYIIKIMDGEKLLHTEKLVVE